jgi:hypothetical protein
MKHPMTEDDWFHYLDDLAPEPDQLRIKRHLRTCARCRETAELMRAVEEALISTGAQLRDTVTLGTAAIAAAKDTALARLDDSSIPLRIGSLHLLLAPMCGVETSTRAIRAAAHRVSASSPGRLEERLWPGFVEHLHVIVATLCGEPAAQLVWERGMSLQQEAA